MVSSEASWTNLDHVNEALEAACNLDSTWEDVFVLKAKIRQNHFFQGVNSYHKTRFFFSGGGVGSVFWLVFFFTSNFWCFDWSLVVWHIDVFFVVVFQITLFFLVNYHMTLLMLWRETSTPPSKTNISDIRYPLKIDGTGRWFISFHKTLDMVHFFRGKFRPFSRGAM